MRALSEKVWDRIRIDFEPSRQTQVAELLDLYDNNERERVQLYILQLAKGDVAELCRFVDAANLDYRDIIYWAENFDLS